MKKLNTLFLLILINVQVYAQKLTADGYKDKYSPIAVSLSESTRVPASIILGVAMLESANGNSRNAKWLNNHFGIKGSNTLKARGAKFRSAYKEFESVEDSYQYFVKMISTRKTFSSLWKNKTDNYKGWAKGLQRVGYASNKLYAEHLIATIENNKLYNFDKKTADVTESVLLKTEEINAAYSPSGSLYYKIKKGDSLSKIAAKFGTTVNGLKALNNLPNNKIIAGKRIKIKE